MVMKWLQQRKWEAHALYKSLAISHGSWFLGSKIWQFGKLIDGICLVNMSLYN